jgi:hypothetical protein
VQPCSRVQIHQYNDPEILEFLNAHGVEYRLLGDHLFVIRTRGHELAAGPGDWLVTSARGDVFVQPGDYARRQRYAVLRAAHPNGERKPARPASQSPGRA